MPRLVFVRPLSAMERVETQRQITDLGSVVLKFFLFLALFLISAVILLFLYQLESTSVVQDFFGMLFSLSTIVFMVLSVIFFFKSLALRRLKLDLRQGVFRIEGPIAIRGQNSFRIGIYHFTGSLFLSTDFSSGDSVFAEFTFGTRRLLSLSKLSPSKSP